jgi:hypothetical protein
MGIEPTSEAWEASILPLYDARSGAKHSTKLSRMVDGAGSSAPVTVGGWGCVKVSDRGW